MEEQEIKQKIIEILNGLEKLEDKKENQEKIFELCYELRLLLLKEKDFKKIFVDLLSVSKKYENAQKIMLNNGVSGKYEKDWIKYKEQKDKEKWHLNLKIQ